MHNKIKTLMNKYKIDWQRPVITELTFFLQYSDYPNYFPFPWATLIDFVYTKPTFPYQSLYNDLKDLVKSDPKFVSNPLTTCCQHIYYYKLYDLFQSLNIKNLYIPHKSFLVDNINGIKHIACPLYASNIEDTKRNEIYLQHKTDLLSKKRNYLLSFQGTYNNLKYISDIRKKILGKSWPSNCFVNKTNEWHFKTEVYGNKLANSIQNNLVSEKDSYNNLMLNSKYSLCPSGTGPNSIRLWESLAFGSIPIVLADSLELPHHDLWDVAILRIKEQELDNLLEIINKIPIETENQMRKNCIFLYQYFKDNYANLKYECSHTFAS